MVTRIYTSRVVAMNLMKRINCFRIVCK
jgi:hypothetical protein